MAKKKSKSSATQPDIHDWITGREPASRRRELRTAVRRLREEFENREPSDLLWWHQVGVLLKEFFPDGKRQYGSAVMKMLAAYLGADDENDFRNLTGQLWQARSVAKMLTATEAKTWAKRSSSKGKRLGAYHVYSLSRLKDKEKRNELLEKCVAENLTITQIKAEVHALIGFKKAGGGRRATEREPPTPEVALREIQVQAKKWMRDHRAWFGRKDASLKKVPKELHTDEFYAGLSDAADAMIEMLDAVDAGLATIGKLARRMEQKKKGGGKPKKKK